MIIFQTESFKLDLTHLDIKFSEENSFVQRGVIKQYSFPFKVPKERSSIEFYEFIASHNSSNPNRFVKGILTRNGKMYDSELMVISIGSTIETTIYYSFDQLTIFADKLNTLPWPTLDIGESIYDYAEDTIAKDYGDTLINFTRVYVKDFHKSYEFGAFTGYINEAVGGKFSDNAANPYGILPPPYRMNEMRPFIYIKYIAEFIFEQIGYTLIGDFMSDSIIDKGLFYHQNSIFYTNKDFEESADLYLQLNTSGVAGYPAGHNKYIHSTLIRSYGTYTATIEVEATNTDLDTLSIRATFDGKIYDSVVTYRAGEYSFNFEFNFEVPKSLINRPLKIEIICKAAVKDTISGTLKLEGTNRPLYYENIQLSQLLPDITVGDFIDSLKETFNLTTDYNIQDKTVSLNYFNSFVENAEAVDLTKFEQRDVPVRLNRSTGYRIQFSNGDYLNIDKTGRFVSPVVGFDEITIPIEPLKPVYQGARVDVEDQSGLSILFYESNPDADPLGKFGDVGLSRIGFIHQYLRSGYYQQLTGEEYNQTVYLPIAISTKITAQSKLWMYNNYFMINSLTRSNLNELVERLDLKMLKIKTPPLFYISVDDTTGDAGSTLLAPDIVVAASSNFIKPIQHPHVTAYTAVSGGDGFGMYWFNKELYADGTSDPQGLELFFEWRVIGSPDGLNSGNFEYRNANKSNVRFRKQSIGVTVAGVYTIQLVVTNSEGVSSFETLTVTVS